MRSTRANHTMARSEEAMRRRAEKRGVSLEVQKAADAEADAARKANETPKKAGSTTAALATPEPAAETTPAKKEKKVRQGSHMVN